MKQIILETSCGNLLGLDMENGVQRFAGIRYGTAGRWEYARPAAGWEGTYDATEFGAACIQNRTYHEESDDNFYYREFRKGEHYAYSEDCFFLNIWKPAQCSGAPVLFYIHGGAFQGGCGNEKHFDGEAYAKRGIIFITCNYRLGALGFCAHPKLAGQDGQTGNYGLFDQLTALKWVHDHISDFGGNPEQISLMGQSAGGMSVQQLCMSPLSKDYIRTAVMTSGGGIGKSFGKYISLEAAYPFWEKVLGQFGNTPDEWRAIPAEKLLEAAAGEAWKPENGIEYLMPVLDGKIVCFSAEEMEQNKAQANIPYMMGSTKDDLVPGGVLDDMAKEWTVLQSKQGMTPSYCFRFERNLPGDDKGAWHSSELWYTLGTLQRSWRPMTNRDIEISENLVSYISHFIRTGDPNGDGLPAWNPTLKAEDPILIIDDEKIYMR